MKILQIHNDYKILGGETKVVENEKKLLLNRNHQVSQYIVHNSRIDDFSIIDKINFFKNVFYSGETYKNMIKVILDFKPDIIHIHNVFPLISPAAYSAAFNANIPVVQTIHNFRFLCPNGLFFRQNEICELCKDGNYFHAIKHKCYKNSYIYSGLYASSIKYHRIKKTFYQKIDLLITLSEFSKKKMIEGGFDSTKIFIKPNFLLQDSAGKSSNSKKDYFLFIGRLSSEKGILTLLEAAKELKNSKIKILGNGEEYDNLANLIKQFQLANVELLGFADGKQKFALIENAWAIIFPSVWYENFPITLLESFASGIPVIASNIGSLPEIVQDKKTGLLFEPGNVQDLASKIKWAQENSVQMQEFGKNARKQFEEKYTSEKNYHMLIEIYQKAIENKQALKKKSYE